jgi:gas vesicle protein
MGEDQSHKAWKWALAVTSLALLIFSLSLIAQGPVVNIFEERVPVTRYVTTTTYVTRQVPRSQILFSGTDLLIPTWGYRYSGPYRIGVGKTLKISWEADTSVNVYVMNDVDWQSRFFGGAPIRWRASKVGSSGTLEFYIQHDEPIYIQVLCPTWCSVKLYRWEEKVEWVENVREAVTETVPIQTEIIQTKTNLQTSHITIGYLLAATSGTMFAISIVFILGSNTRFSRKATEEESTRLLSYQGYLEDLRRLMTQRNLLRAMYERGEIEEDVYGKLESEISEKISSIKDVIYQERATCENELKSLEEKLASLKKRLEELRVRKYLGIIRENEFEREMQLIMKDFESMKKRREYLKSILEILKTEEI